MTAPWPPAKLSRLSASERLTSLQHLTLSDLMARAHDDGAGCLVWDGYALFGAAPQWRIDYQLWPVRRLLWELVHGPIHAKHQIGLSCTEPLCVHPDHLVSRTRSSIQHGRKQPAATIIRIAQAKRAGSQLDMATVREIRASDEKSIEIDRRMGWSLGYASRIRLGLAWADTASPFAGLGARP